MRRKTNNALMMAYIIFVFVAVFTRPLYARSKWSYIVTAITVTSWVLVLSDACVVVADLLQETILKTKPKFESYLFQLQNNLRINKQLDIPLKDKYGVDTGNTIGQTLKSMEEYTLNSLKTLSRVEKSQKWIVILSEWFMLIGFVLFFCILLFDPLFAFFNSRLEGLTVLAFGSILAAQFVSNITKDRIQKIRDSLDDLNESMEALNQSCEAEAIHNAY